VWIKLELELGNRKVEAKVEVKVEVKVEEEGGVEKE